jgi:hypothetical protein
MGLAFGPGVHTEVLPCMSHSRESGNPRRPHGLYIEPCPDGRCAEFWTVPRGETAPHAPLWLASEQRAVEDGQMPHL